MWEVEGAVHGQSATPLSFRRLRMFLESLESLVWAGRAAEELLERRRCAILDFKPAWIAWANVTAVECAAQHRAERTRTGLDRRVAQGRQAAGLASAMYVKPAQDGSAHDVPGILSRSGKLGSVHRDTQAPCHPAMTWLAYLQ